MRKEGREDSNLSKATQKRKLCLHNTLTLRSTPHPSFRLTCLWVVLQTKVNKNPCLQKKKEKKDNLIAGAVPLVRSRSWQSSVIVTLAEARCAVVPEQEQAEPGGEGWNSWGKGVPWASGIGVPGSHWNPLMYHPLPHTVSYGLKKPHTNEHIQKPTSKGNLFCNAYTNCDLFLCNCGRQPATALVCDSCFHRCASNVT